MSFSPRKVSAHVVSKRKLIAVLDPVARAESHASRLIAQAEQRDKELRERSEQLREVYHSSLRQFGKEELVRAIERGARDERIEGLCDLLDAVRQTREGLRSMTPWLERLVGICLQRILGEMDRDDVVRRIVRQAVSELDNASGLTLRVAPDRLGPVRACLAELLEVMPHLQIVVDPGLEPDQLYLESLSGVTDISLSVQIDELQAGLRRLAEQRSPT